MAGAMRKMAVYLGLVEDDQYDDDYYDDEPQRERAETRSNRDSLRVTEAPAAPSKAADESLTSRRFGADRTASTTDRPNRDWRTDTPVSDAGHPAGSRARVTPRPAGADRGSDQMKITTLHPRSYNDARRIGEEFRSGRPVIMDLTDLDDVDAKRIVDFAAGLVFGLRGSIERVTNKVFMLSPADANVSAETARAQLQRQG